MILGSETVLKWSAVELKVKGGFVLSLKAVKPTQGFSNRPRIRIGVIDEKVAAAGRRLK